MNIRTLFEKGVNAVLAVFGVRLARTAAWRQEQEKLSFLSTLTARERLLALTRLLVPQAAEGVAKIRLGSAYDGGYVCLDDFSGVESAFSLGICDNDDWDVAAAEKGLEVYQFDHTVDAPPHEHARCHFHKHKIVAQKKEEHAEDIASLLTYTSASAAPIMKMDIEGDEWPVLERAAPEDLRRFSQIVVEFHGFGKMVSDPWYPQTLAVLQKLNTEFGVVHVHGNNCGPWASIGHIPFPDILEVTYANRSRYRLTPSEEVFPTVYDAPNNTKKGEMNLGRFVF